MKANAIAGREFASWAAFEAHLEQWTREVADLRVHGTTGEPPIVRFQRDGFGGVLQADAYAAYNALADPVRAGGPVTLAYCWSHVRRRFYEIAQGGNAPIAEEVFVRHHRALWDRAHDPRRRTRAAPQRSLGPARPLIDDLRAWLEAKLAKVSGGSRIAQAIR